MHDCAVVGAEDPRVGPDHRRRRRARRRRDPDPEDLREHRPQRSLRGSRTPDRVVFRDELPTNATGKVLRRELVSELNSQ